MHVSEDYISLAIAKLAKLLGLSESLAGATLLALANGVTDLVTVCMAALAGSTDNDLAIGSLFGANLFTCTVVLAVTILATKKKSVANLNKGNALFDLFFFIVGIVIFVILGSLNTYMIVTGSCLLLVYGFYLYFLVRRDAKAAKEFYEIELAQEGILDAEKVDIDLPQEESVVFLYQGARRRQPPVGEEFLWRNLPQDEEKVIYQVEVS